MHLDRPVLLRAEQPFGVDALLAPRGQETQRGSDEALNLVLRHLLVLWAVLTASGEPVPVGVLRPAPYSGRHLTRLFGAQVRYTGFAKYPKHSLAMIIIMDWLLSPDTFALEATFARTNLGNNEQYHPGIYLCYPQGLESLDDS